MFLISSGPDAGKSILGKQFLFNVLTRGKGAVLVTLDEHSAAFRRSFRYFNWDVSMFERDGKFAIIDAFTTGIGSVSQREEYVVKYIDHIHELIDVLRQAIKDTVARRLTVGSVSTLYPQ